MRPEFKLDGVATPEEWKKRLEQAQALARQHNALEEAKVSARRTRAWIVAGIGLLVAAGLLWKLGVGFAIGALVVAVIAAVVVGNGPPADVVGLERIAFVLGLLKDLGPAAPGGQMKLTAALDPRTGVPQVPVSSGVGDSHGEKEDAWLSGSLIGVPGLRLSWKVVEWRRAMVRRKKNRKGKLKQKAKLAFSALLAVRLDADRVLFGLRPAPAQKPGADEGEVTVSEKPRCYRMRATRQVALKSMLPSADIAQAFAVLRQQQKPEAVGYPYTSLIALMRQCEGRLAPLPARKAA